MKILYVTHMWTALEAALYEGKEIQGMPAFFNVLKELVARENEIDMLIFDTKVKNKGRELNIKVEWLKKINYSFAYAKAYTGLRKPISEISSFFSVYSASKKLIKDRDYDFIYGHGPISEAASVASGGKIPFGQRRYGDTYYDFIKQKGLLYMVLSQPTNYYSYKRKKKFMVATNDGSRIDLAYKLINKDKKPYPLYYWLNGFNRVEKSGSCPDTEPYLLYTARITESKRQDLGVILVSMLKERDIIIKLYIAGPIDTQSQYEKIISTAAEKGVSDQVIFLGSRDREELCAYAEGAVACLSFYTPCNLGNVFIENFTLGAVTVSSDDGSLDGIIVNGENGFLVKDMKEAADVIENLISDKALSEGIKKNARRDADKIFISWKDRIEKEIALIEENVKK